MRFELAAQRRQRVPFSVAWEIALDYAIAPLGPAESGAWLIAFYGTWRAWADAYNGGGRRMLLNPSMLD